MDNSTQTKAPAQSKIKKENESIMKHVVDMNERINYIMDTLKNQTEVVRKDHDLLERIRIRMGL